MSLSQSSFNGLLTYTFTPSNMVQEENDIYEDEIYDENLNDTSCVTSHGINAREALQGILDDVFKVHDQLRDKDLPKKFENFCTQHVNECRSKIASNKNKTNNNNCATAKRTRTVRIVQENYNRSVHQVEVSHNC